MRSYAHHLTECTCHRALAANETCNIFIGSLDDKDDILFIAVLNLSYFKLVFVFNHRCNKVEQNLFKIGSYKGLSGRIYATVSNVFTISKYNGIDPEINNGYDNNLYPRPISYILGLNLNF